MAESTKIMRPGILVALKTGVTGGVHYQRVDLESNDDGTVAKWETTRHIDDPKELKKAGEVVRLASAAIARLCIRTSFGMLCPLDREEELDLAIAAARVTVDLWNTDASYSTISVTAVKGRIADNDEEAIRAMIDEARDFVRQMQDGISSADVKAIQAAASRARALSGMMGDEAAEGVKEVIAAARSVASDIARRSVKTGKAAVDVIQDVNIESFSKARFSFLQTTDAEEAALPAIDKQRMAQIDAYRQENIVDRIKDEDGDD